MEGAEEKADIKVSEELKDEDLEKAEENVDAEVFDQ